MAAPRLDLTRPESSRSGSSRAEQRTWIDVQAPYHSVRRYRAVRLFVGLVARLYSKVLVEGVERLPDGPSIVCFTHQNWADPFFMFATMPGRPRMYFFGPEQEEMRRGLRNRLMRWSGVVIPYRPGRRGLVAATGRVESVLGGDAVVAIAGEGQIHAGEGIVLPLHEGPAYLSLRAGVPLVPVVINGTSWLGFRRVVRVRVGLPVTVRPRTRARPSADEITRLTAQTQVALETLVSDFPDQPLPGRVGRWLTELFNDWPNGSRPPVQARKASREAIRPV
jgi:1-acyl-sn-glycerol-3-phosphate acyltransferase